jgi:hypothetical protein
MTERSIRANRRAILWATAAGAAGVAPVGAAQQSATPAPATPEPVGGPATAEPPAWLFVVHLAHDPYAGTIQVPQELPDGTRPVAVEVEIVNDSDQALAFTPIDVRLRDAAGIDYRGGGAIGTEPTINPRNLNPGERSRGWVWFIVPEDAVPVEIVYVAPQPQFRVPLPL